MNDKKKSISKKIVNTSKRIKIVSLSLAMLIVFISILSMTRVKSKAMDHRVLEAQQWVNATYKGKVGYKPVEENGKTGKDTVKALSRALQIELGVSVDGDIGDGTLSKFKTIKVDSEPSNIIKIIQHGLYCKGYSAGEVNGKYHETTQKAIMKLKTDAGFSNVNSDITGVWLKSVLSTDAMVLVPGGDPKIRDMQQYLNKNYHAYVGVAPCDGRYTADTNKALTKALQAEEGYSVAEANGNFGDGTWAKLPALSHGNKGIFVKLMKMAMYFNEYNRKGDFSDSYGSDFAAEVKKFQKFMKLPNTDGNLDKGTIRSLFTSNGDISRPAIACDTATKLDKNRIASLRAAGFKYVGRYLTKVPGGLDKNITRQEADLILGAGMKIIPIYQTYGNKLEYFTVSNGDKAGFEAVLAAIQLGIPNGSTIYFAVDYDVQDGHIKNQVIPYFRAIQARVKSLGNKYSIGVYGARNVCTQLSNAGITKYSYVCDGSKGFSGNFGFTMPKNWAFDQFNVNTKCESTDIDRVGVSGRDAAVSRLERNQEKINYELIEAVQGYYSADPVNLASGAHEITYEAIKAYGAQELGITLEYNSEVLSKGALGKGWSHNFDSRLQVISDNEETEEDDSAIRVFVTSGTYRDYKLKEGSTNEYVCSVKARQNDLLKANEDGTFTLNCNGETIYTYNKEGKLVKEQTKQGYSYELQHSANEIKVIDSTSGKYITFTLDEKGLITSVKNEDNNACTFTYDANDCLVQITDASGSATKYTYDAEGRIITGVDNTGVTFFKNEYDELGRVVKQYDSKEGTTLFSYNTEDENGNTRVDVTDMNGNVKTSIFNSDRLLIETIDANGQSVKYDYDVNGNIISTTDELGNVAKQQYDNTNRKVLETDKLGATTNYVYDEKGNVVKITYPNGSEETYEYNNKNLMTKLVERNGRVSTFKYDDKGYVVEKKLGDNVYKYTYEGGKISTATDPLGNVTKYTYNASGHLISTTMPEGNTTTNTVDAKGNVIKVTDEEGKSSAVEYSCRDLPTKQTDANGNVTEYVYDGSGNIIEEKYADGTSLKNTYDAEGNLIKAVDPRGNATTYEYDKAGNLIKEIDAKGQAKTYEYDEAGNVIKEVDVNGGVIERTYDAAGNVLTEKNDAGETTSYKYDIMSQLIETVNSQGGKTAYEYDKAGNLIKETDPNGNTTTTEYDLDGNVVKTTDAKGNVTKFEYDVCGRVVKEIDAIGSETTYKYDKNGNRISSTDALGNTTTYKYNNSGKVTEITDALGNTSKTEYDAAGNITKTFNAKGDLIVETVYDAKNQPIKSIDADGNEVIVTYDALGNMLTSTDANGNVTTYEYDELNRMTKTTNAAEQVSSAAYTADGQISELKGTGGSLKSYTYDKQGRVVSESTTSGATKTYTYDEKGNLSKTTNGRKQEISYTYDNTGKVQTVETPEGKTEYKYDELYNVTSIEDSVAGKISKEYDALNRVTSYTDVNKQTVKYTYDKVGNITKITYPDGKEVAYEYDKVGNMTSVKDWDGNKTTYEYDANGNITKMTRPDKSVLTKTYDKLERLITAKDVAADGNVISSYKYIYDKAGNLVEEISETENKKYEMTYDNLYRVTKRTTKDLATGEITKEESFTFDSACNITNAKVNTEEVTMTYDANNKLLKLQENEFVYDEDGNMTKGLIGDTSTSLKYDSQNRLVEIEDAKYTYDAEGTRTAKNNVKYTYNTVNTLSQLLVKQDGDKTTKYVYGAGALISQHKKDEVRIFHYDLRGSTIALTDLKGKITDTYEYDAYGKVTAIEGSLESTDFLYNGRDGVMNEGNGLYYMRTRYYSPDLRRFINADILTGSIDDSDTLNQYAYVEGNPFSMIDPFGMCAEPGSGTKSKSIVQKLKGLGKSIKKGYKKFADAGHLVLDIAGIIPGLGMIPDGINVVWYLAELDGANVALSAAAFVPLIGDVAGAGKVVVKGAKAVDKAADAAKVVDKVSDAAKAADKVGDAARAVDKVNDVAKHTVRLKHVASSGVELVSTPGKTTTVLGRFGSDTQHIIKELNIPKNTNFSGNKGGFNLLNTPDEFYKTADQFWNEYNKPFLDEAIKRGDEIIMATPLTKNNLYTKSGDFTGYGREYDYLKKHGYKYVNGRMKK